MVEPTPFTHVSGYANRFQEMLHFLHKAGDDVDILTVDAKTPPAALPKKFGPFNIHYTQGFTFPLYKQISLSMDLPEMRGIQLLDGIPRRYGADRTKDESSLQYRPDLIHVTSPGFLLFAALFYARVLKIPLLISYHTHLPTYGKNYLGFVPGIERLCWDTLRWVHSRADLTLVTSPQLRAEFVAQNIPRVDVWRKGIDTRRFTPAAASASMRRKMLGLDDAVNTEKKMDDEYFLMVYVGRLGAEKRLKDLRDILLTMQKAGTTKQQPRLCIVGTGPQERELVEYFAGTPTVFTGQLSGDQLSAAFASADVFVMPSDSETLGFVVLESMASGVPVVGCAAGGIPDLIHDGVDGYLVPTADIETYVDRLTRLSKDTTLRQSLGAAARAEAEKWNWEAATSYLRNVQYETARRNFHLRAFGGYGRPRTAGVWRLWRYRLHSVLRRVLGRSGGPAASTTRFFKTVRDRLAWLAHVVVESTHKIKRTAWFQFGR
jgi:sulfoquinovosyltransferase